jgi:hypothetical protein
MGLLRLGSSSIKRFARLFKTFQGLAHFSSMNIITLGQQLSLLLSKLLCNSALTAES